MGGMGGNASWQNAEKGLCSGEWSLASEPSGGCTVGASFCVGWQNKRVSNKSISPKTDLSTAAAPLRAGSARGMACRQSRVGGLIWRVGQRSGAPTAASGGKRMTLGGRSRVATNNNSGDTPRCFHFRLASISPAAPALACPAGSCARPTGLKALSQEG